MALVTRKLASFNGGTASASYTFDDASLVIQSLIVVNDGPVGTITLTLRDKITDAIIFGPTARAFGTGTFVQDVSGSNVLMVLGPGKGGVIGPQLPFFAYLDWS